MHNGTNRFPNVLATTDDAVDERDASGNGASALRVLVVDDSRDYVMMMSMFLELNGYKTHTASNGLEAVECAETFRPDVILLDIGLPKLNGYDACRKIREQPWSKDMVLIAVTGWGGDEDRHKSKEAGFDCHLVKPVSVDTLLTLLPELVLTHALA